jgi:hypothetical protein
LKTMILKVRENLNTQMDQAIMATGKVANERELVSSLKLTEALIKGVGLKTKSMVTEFTLVTRCA